METINNWLTSGSELLSKLYGLPGGMFVLIVCIVLGYVLRAARKFPNDAIPLAVILAGIGLNMLIADPRSDKLPYRIWMAKNAGVGMIVGFAAWRIHKKLLKKLETKIPWLCYWLDPSFDSDPQAFKKPEGG